MASPCRRTFDETLLSGYLDLALTQGEEQRVRLHLEDCPHCRALLEQLRTYREVTMTTSFHTPPDDSWNEAPGSGWSRLSLRLGWLLVVLWGLSLGGFALWQLWTGPERLLTKLLAFGGISGFALLALSVLLDRLESYRTDRYRRVEK